MRLKSGGKFDAHGNRFLETTIFLECGHEFVYQGDALEAEKRLKGSGGSISSIGFTRCRDCTQSSQAALQHAIRR